MPHAPRTTPAASHVPLRVAPRPAAQVAYKRGRLVEKSKKQAKLEEYLRSHAVPVVRGPGGALYLIDHHHLAAALAKNGVVQVGAQARRGGSGWRVVVVLVVAGRAVKLTTV